MQIDCFTSPVSPFACPAGLRLQEIAARHGATIRYRPLDASRLFPRTGGQVLAERHESRKAYRLQELRRWAAIRGMTLDLQPPFFPVNPAPASCAIIAAQIAGGGDLAGLVHAFPRAVWAERRDIADSGTVADILRAQGFDPAIADRHMLAAAGDHAANLEEAVARGVFGVPFHVVGEEKFRGQDRLDHLDLHLAGRL